MAFGARVSSMSDIFERLSLRRVVNASGTETGWGAAPVRREVLDAVLQIAPHSVFMSELQAAASRVISDATSSEAGCVTGCTAASIAMAVAGSMTGRDLGKVEQLPDTVGMKSEVVMQRGHEVSYGHHLSQNVRLTGARVVEIGAATQAGLYQLRHALNERTTAALYVVSHLTPQNRMIRLEEFVGECRARGVPVIVDAASMPDPRPYLSAGADIVAWSAQKSLSSFTAGVVAGRRDLVHAILYQEHGIGRPMKVGKEGVVAAIAAVEAWTKRDPDADERRLVQRLGILRSRLEDIGGVVVSRAGRQARVAMDASQSVSATAVAAFLAEGDPAILTWSHFAREGELYLAIGKLPEDQFALLVKRLDQGLRGAAAGCETSWLPIADSFEQSVAAWDPSPSLDKIHNLTGDAR